MVVRAGGYYGAAFQGACVVKQRDPLSPTICNVVADAVVRHWVTVIVEGAEERGERGQEGRQYNALLYAKNGMVELSDPRWLQGVFSTLDGLFNRVVLWNNVGKKFGMVCCPCQEAGTQLEAVHERRITGEGPSYQERQKGWVQCRDCGEDTSVGSLEGHMMTQHGRATDERRS